MKWVLKSLGFRIRETGDVWLSSHQEAVARDRGFHWPNSCHGLLSRVLNCLGNLAKIGIFRSSEATWDIN